MTTVYVWNALDLTGHVSVQLADGYFSFQPKDSSLIDDVTGSPAKLASRDSDFAHGGRFVHRITIDCLDEELMRRRIGEIDDDITDRTLNYKLLSTNCSSMAADVLYVGKKLPFNPHKSMKQIWNELRRRPYHHDHGRLLELVREVIEDSALHSARRGRVGSIEKCLVAILAAADLTSREFCWTPGDVKILAEEFANSNP